MTNEWVIGDSRRDILAKLVRSAGGEVNFVDTEYHLLKKYLQLIKFYPMNKNEKLMIDMD